MNDPAVAHLAGPERLAALEGQYLTYIGANQQMAVSFVCRRMDQDCHYFGPNSDWIKVENNNHFVCPMCKHMYAPWKVKEGVLLPFQKIVIVTDLDKKVM
jgi:hypothetical protein